MSLIFKDSGHQPVDPAAARKRATLMSLPFAAMGLIALILLLHDGLLGGVDRPKLFKLVSVIAASIGFIALIFGVTAKKGLFGGTPPSAAGLEKPWLQRADWATGRIPSSGFPHAKSYLFMGIALCVLGGLIAVLVVPKALKSGNDSALVALVFPVIGIAFLTGAVRKILANRRFGACVFEMARTPAQAGGVLEGVLRTGVPLNWQGPLHLILLCIRKTTSGAGQNRRTDEKILWQDEAVFKSPADLPGSTPGGGVPVRFELPPGQPECSKHGSEVVEWRLEMKMPGANFHMTFEVPVFNVADTPPNGS